MSLRIGLLVPTLLLTVGIGLPGKTAHAGAWTRDRGSTYINLSYSRIATNAYFGSDFKPTPFSARYTQHSLGLYAEYGLLTRWLTATFEGQLYRRSSLELQGGADAFYGYTEGLGDVRLGLWSGLVDKPLRFSVGVIAGIPTGDPRPTPPPGSSADAVATAASLPTGDGEADFEFRTSLGYSFGGKRYWPLIHYVIVEAGVWLRTQGFAHSFTFKGELGIKFPWKFIDRFWFIARVAGMEAFLRQEDVATQCDGSNAFVGLGNCVTYTSYGFDVAGRIYKGLGASIGLDSAFRARYVAAGANLRVSLSYEY